MVDGLEFDLPLATLARQRTAKGLWDSVCAAPHRDGDFVSAYVSLALAEFAASGLGTHAQRAAAVEMAQDTALALSLRQLGSNASEVTGLGAADPVTTFHVIRLVELLDQNADVAAQTGALHAVVRRHPSLNSFLNHKLDRALLNQPTEADATGLISLHHVGGVSTVDLAEIWRHRFAPEQGWDGTWDSYEGHGYGLATAMIVALWEAAGRPDPRPRDVACAGPQETLFERCNLAWAQSRLDARRAAPATREIFQSMAAEAQWGRMGPLTCAAALRLAVSQETQALAPAGRPDLTLVG